MAIHLLFVRFAEKVGSREWTKIKWIFLIPYRIRQKNKSIGLTHGRRWTEPEYTKVYGWLAGANFYFILFNNSDSDFALSFFLLIRPLDKFEIQFILICNLNISKSYSPKEFDLDAMILCTILLLNILLLRRVRGDLAARCKCLFVFPPSIPLFYPPLNIIILHKKFKFLFRPSFTYPSLLYAFLYKNIFFDHLNIYKLKKK